ncbi:MAG: efflux RND transporter periplasmic adaptor subunit [Burkholderiales bacterium]|nr:efflux RND transporter periplasmic adaptor subunit [Burkholderiales bacterium]
MNKQTMIAGCVAGIAGIALGIAASRHWPTEASQAASMPTTKTALAPAGGLANGATLGEALVKVQPVEMRQVRDAIRINGKLALNGMRVNQISARLAGRVDKIMLFEGASVRAGEAVALLYSPEFISAQNEYLLARNTVRMLSGKSTSDLLDDAKLTLASARTKLKVQGASDEDVQKLDQSGAIQQYLVIRSPISGRFIKRNVDPGGYLDTGASLGTVADLSSLWFLGNAFETDIPRLREGEAADIVISGIQASGPVRGKISFISPTVDAQTHSVTVRVDLPNERGQLKPDMFAKAEIALDQRLLPVVPRAAVVQDGAESFIVVQRSKQRLERVAVDVVPADDPDYLAITWGIGEGDQIVVDGSVLVDRSLTNPQAEKLPSRVDAVKRGAGS